MGRTRPIFSAAVSSSRCCSRRCRTRSRSHSRSSLPPRAFPLPQQQQISTTMMMSHRQEQLLFPLLKHMIVTSL